MILAMVFANVWGVLQLAALATLTRTIRVRTLLVAIAVGLYTCSVTAVLLQVAWTRVVASLAGVPLYTVVSVASYTLDPFIEELVKVLPLVALIVMIRTVREQWSFADCVLVGAAGGSGFGLAENLFRYSSAVGRALPDSGGWVVPVNISLPTVPSLWTTLTSWLPSGAASESFFAVSPAQYNLHLEWSALGGLAVALLLLGRGRASRWAGVALWLYVAADHTAVNWTGSGASGLFSVVAAPLNALRSKLWLMPVAALAVAWWLDRARQRWADAPELALTIERQSRWRGWGTLRAAASRPLSSVLWLGGLTRLRRAYATAVHRRSDSAAELRQAILLARDRIQGRLAGLTLVEGWPGISNHNGVLQSLRRPKTIVWLGLMLPSVVWLVLGGYPQTAWLQAALAKPAPWMIVRAVSFLGLAWLGWQLAVGILRRSWARSAPFGDLAGGQVLHLLSGAGAFLLGTYALVLGVTGSAPGDHVLANFHVLEAIGAALVIGTLLTAVAAVVLFPPIAGAMVDAGLLELMGAGAETEIIGGGLSAVAEAGATVAEGGFGSLAGVEMEITGDGMAALQSHLAQFEAFEPNTAMLDRLQEAFAAGRKISGADLSFYMHELAESSLMAEGLPYEAAHAQALIKFGASPFSVYAPEVIRAFLELFNSNWLMFWGIGP